MSCAIHPIEYWENVFCIIYELSKIKLSPLNVPYTSQWLIIIIISKPSIN